MTVKQASLKLGICAGTVYALCAAGRIQHERHGLGRGVIRISDEALEEYRRSCVVEPVVTRRQASQPASLFSELNGNRLAKAWQKH